MRLLKTSTMQLVSVDAPSQYAILSHRWQDEEILFDDFDEDGNLILDKAKKKKGYTKLDKCCERARKDNYEYVWIDTFCIDKSSSAELTESLNSMYAYYLHAALCYVILHDVSYNESPAVDKDIAFRGSEWFKRGWTLQELIAPSNIIFYSKEWKPIGTKSSLCSLIAGITNVEKDALLFQKFDNISVARKMSWASKRETAAVEDRAYSLLGIFGVNMPVIYGEGSRAFIRLQQEILRSTNDHTIFAWTWLDPNVPLPHEGGMLAVSPCQFRSSGFMQHSQLELFRQRFTEPRFDSMRHDFSLTNNGVHIQLPRKVMDRGAGTYVAFLSCHEDKGETEGEGEHEGQLVGIYIQKTNIGDQYVRIRMSEFAFEDNVSGAELKDMYIRTEPTSLNNHYPIRTSTHGHEDRATNFVIRHSDGIAPLPYRAPDPVADPVTDPDVRVSWIQLEEGTSTQSALTFPPKYLHENVYASLLFKVTATDEKFVATFGVHKHGLWSNIESDIKNANHDPITDDAAMVKEVHDSYDFEHGRNAKHRWESLDRVTKELRGSRTSVYMNVRKGNNEDKKAEDKKAEDKKAEDKKAEDKKTKYIVEVLLRRPPDAEGQTNASV